MPEPAALTAKYGTIAERDPPSRPDETARPGPTAEPDQTAAAGPNAEALSNTVRMVQREAAKLVERVRESAQESFEQHRDYVQDWKRDVKTLQGADKTNLVELKQVKLTSTTLTNTGSPKTWRSFSVKLNETTR